MLFKHTFFDRGLGRHEKMSKIALIYYIESFHDKKSHIVVCRKFHEKIKSHSHVNNFHGKSHVEKIVEKVIKSHENRLSMTYRVVSDEKKS